MIVWYTPHAQLQMRRRSVSQAEVEAVLLDPEITQMKRHGRQGAWRRLAGRAIMVIHEPTEDGTATVVVTVYPQTRRPQR
ncbi:MAG: DUF4258 domain-containing protein [Candidatus Baltobacteraceae bacterium]